MHARQRNAAYIMQEENKFTTQAEAEAYLKARGWKYSHKSNGDKVYKQEGKSFVCIIVGIKHGWRIDRWSHATQ